MTGAAEGRQVGRRIALLLEYDGTAYCGSQYQENGPSIQAELEAAINNLTAESVRATFAGRTDAGVHALGQVASFETSGALTTAELRSGLNHFLPRDIVVKQAREAPEWFDPRRSATRRRYRYRIANRETRPSLDRFRVWHIAKRLDVEGMARAAESLVGEHDFAAFAAEYDGSTRRTLRRCEVSCEEDGEITVELEAKAFLPHQVRRTVGPLVEIGLGRMSKEQLVALLNIARPSSAGPAAPAHALYLVGVKYEGFAFDAT
jgi:tRNA pseudouridine38-40 synthase